MVRTVDRAHEIGLDTLQVFSDNPTAWRRRSAAGQGPPGLPGPARRARDGSGRDPRVVPRQPGRLRPDVRRQVRRGPPVRARCGARATAPGSSTSTRVAPGHRCRHGHRPPGGRRRPRPRRGRRRSGRRDPRPRELGRQRRRPGLLDRGDGHDPRHDRGPRAFRPGASRSASTPPTCGAPATRSRIPTRSIDWSTRSTGSIGLDRLAMIHFNDSRAALGSHADRHEHVGAGGIGPAGMGAPDPPPAAHARDLLPRDARGWTRATTRSTPPASATSSPVPRPTPGALIRRSRSGPRRRERHAASQRRPRDAAKPRVDRRELDRAGRAPGARWRVVRFVGLPGRGTWDADQGHDMLVLLRLVRDGHDPAARAADLDRRLPPRRALLLPALAGGVRVGREPDARRRRDRARRGRRGRGHLVAGPVDRGPDRGRSSRRS